MSERKIRELTALYEIARLAAASLDLEATLAAILRALAEHLEMERATLTLLDPANGTLAVRASSAPPSPWSAPSTIPRRWP